MVVLSVAVMLTGLLMPALSQVRENARRVICGTNERQIGLAITMYAMEYDALPASRMLEGDDFSPWELMAGYHPIDPVEAEIGELPWDGLGLLHRFGYCNGKSFYCPSHHGDHLYENYEDAWFTGSSDESIYINYHYAGHKDWETGAPRRLEDPRGIILVTDGLRTRDDINHADGINVLFNDGSVHFQTNVGAALDVVPRTVIEDNDEAYLALWRTIEQAIYGYDR